MAKGFQSAQRSEYLQTGSSVQDLVQALIRVAGLRFMVLASAFKGFKVRWFGVYFVLVTLEKTREFQALHLITRKILTSLAEP